MPLTTILEQPTNHESESIPKPLVDNLQKHCKEIGLISTLPSLFVLVTPDEEKRFGLNNVKEFCVSKSVFANMSQSFKKFELETFCEQKGFLFDEICDPSLPLSHNLIRKTFGGELIRSDKNFLYDECFVKLEHFHPAIRRVLHDLHGTKRSLGSEDVEKCSKLAQSSLFASNRISLLALCSKEDVYVNEYPNAIWVYDLVYPYIFDHTVIIRLSMSKESNAGFKALKRPKRSQRREEDKRFKPPDLDQDKHQEISFFLLIKEAPPDPTYKPKPSLDEMGGMSLSPHNYVSINLSYIHADGSDLRTNPFQEGEDDMILTSTKEMENEPELEPKGSKLKAKEHGAVKDAWREPVGSMTRSRTKKLKECIGGMLKPTAQPGAKLSTLVLIQAH